MNTITNLKLTAVALTALTLTSFTDGKTRGRTAIETCRTALYVFMTAVTA